MAKLDFVDTYIHLMDPADPRFPYPLLRPGFRHPHLAEHTDRLKGRRYPGEAYLEETRNSNVIAAVQVDADSGAKDPVVETEWLAGEAKRTGIPQAIVAYANLQEPDAEETLLRHLEFPGVRGIRHRSPNDYLSDPAFHQGFRLLAKYDLSCDMSVRFENVGKARDLALKNPNTAICFNHCGMALALGVDRDKEYFDSWKKSLRLLAEPANAYCKISGVPVFDHSWTVESMRPWVQTVIEAFGPRRCMFASHWPIDTLFSSHEKLIDAYAEIIQGFSEDEQKDMFSRNALKLYRISTRE